MKPITFAGNREMSAKQSADMEVLGGASACQTASASIGFGHANSEHEESSLSTMPPRMGRRNFVALCLRAGPLCNVTPVIVQVRVATMVHLVTERAARSRAGYPYRGALLKITPGP